MKKWIYCLVGFTLFSCLTSDLYGFNNNGFSRNHDSAEVNIFQTGRALMVGETLTNPLKMASVAVFSKTPVIDPIKPLDLGRTLIQTSHKIGDKVTFFFKTDKDCRVTLLNVGTDGQVQILFPNEFHKDNQVKAGTTYTIPPREAKFAIKAKAPAGEDVVKAIATLDQVDLIKDQDVVAVKGDNKGFKSLKKNAKTLAIELEETLKPVDPKKWSEAEKVVKIVP
jgi:hypothetical protein